MPSRLLVIEEILLTKIFLVTCFESFFVCALTAYVPWIRGSKTKPRCPKPKKPSGVWPMQPQKNFTTFYKLFSTFAQHFTCSLQSASFYIRRTVIVMISYLFVSSNILSHDSPEIKAKEACRYFRQRYFRLHYKTKFLKRRLCYSSGHYGSFDPSVIINAEAHMMYGNIDSPKKAKKKKKATLVVKQRSLIILEQVLEKKWASSCSCSQ